MAREIKKGVKMANWTVLGNVHPLKWRCRCECGAIRSISNSELQIKDKSTVSHFCLKCPPHIKALHKKPKRISKYKPVKEAIISLEVKSILTSKDIFGTVHRGVE